MGSAFTPQPRPAPVLGMVRNVGPENIDPRAWVTAHNVVIRNGAVEKICGWHPPKAEPIPPESGFWNGWAQQKVDGSVSLILPARLGAAALHNLICTSKAIYRLDSLDEYPTRLNEDEFGAADTDRWQADYELGNWYLTNPGVGLLRYNGQTLTRQPTGDPPVTASYIAQYVHHLILARLRGGGNDPWAEHSYLGSGLATREAPIPDWETDNPASDALLDSIPDDATPFTGLRRLAGGLAMYKENSIHVANYVGLPNVYTIDCRVPGRGLLAPHSLTDNGRAHIFVGQDNLWTFNGSDPQAIGDRVWQWLKEQTTDSARARIWSWHDPRFKELYFAFNGTTALVWNYEYDVFTTRDLPFTALGFVALTGAVPTFDELTQPMDTIGVLEPAVNLEGFDAMGADADGVYQIFDEDYDRANGQRITATLQSGTTSSLRYRTCGGLHLDVSGLTKNETVEVFVSGRRTLSDPILWKGPFLYNGGGRVHCMVGGFHHDFKFVKAGGRMALRGYAPLFQERGER
jgi:hypothetical protein